jgi:hypothetical protein
MRDVAINLSMKGFSMKKRILCLLTPLLLILAADSYAAKIFDGYEGIAWGTHFHKIMEAYPKGQIGEYNNEIIYTQDNPDETIASRLFAFKDGKLTSVAVTFDGNYVKKTGLEKLKQKYLQQYGKGEEGKSAHMVTYSWEGKKTRVKFIYVPNRPEMTVLQFEKK